MQNAVLTTDGACLGNPGSGGWACILRIGNVVRELSGCEPHTTNNRMEMTAAIRGLMALDAPTDVEIVTDSKYLLQGATEYLPRWKRNNWKTVTGKPVQNQDLWLELEIQLQRHKVRWTWVRGHQDHAIQNKCDRLASMAARGQQARNAEQA